MGRQHDPRRHLLPFNDWPGSDKAAWGDLFRSGSPIDEPGACAHLAAATIRKRARGYGHWLTFLAANYPGSLTALPHARFQPEIVRAYRAELEQLMAPFTVLLRLADLLSIAVGMDPTGDWRFLRRLTNGLRQTATPVRDKPARVVHSSRLFQLGLELIERSRCPAGDGRRASRTRAILLRDGLSIALLAARPLRMRNLAGLEIGRTFLAGHDGCDIAIPADETKTWRPIDLDVPDVLVPAFRDYLDGHRGILLDGKASTGLWITYRGDWMTAHSLYMMITYRTRKAFRRPINPHLFRDAAATSVAIDDPDNMRVATTLLGHGTLATTIKHYNQARMLTATRAYQDHLRQLRRRVMHAR
jgi:integrase/recombinase XerD